MTVDVLVLTPPGASPRLRLPSGSVHTRELDRMSLDITVDFVLASKADFVSMAEFDGEVLPAAISDLQNISACLAATHVGVRSAPHGGWHDVHHGVWLLDREVAQGIARFLRRQPDQIRALLYPESTFVMLAGLCGAWANVDIQSYTRFGTWANGLPHSWYRNTLKTLYLRAKAELERET